MNMKNVTKTGLNNFINQKVNGNKADIRGEINVLITEKLNPILDSYVDCKNVEKAAQKFVDEMQKALETYSKPLESWKYKQLVSDTNRYATGLGHRIREEVKTKALEHIENPQKGAFDFGNDSVNAVVRDLQELCKPFYKRINDLEKLSNELDRVIKNEHNGGRAYKALIALGVDMESYEESGANLPAIVKFSVDVCVLNGDCDKKASA